MTKPSATPTPQLELIGARTGNCLRVAIGLSEAGLPYRVRQLDLRAGEQRSAAHLALNAAGKVPVLLIRQSPSAAPEIVTQSNAMLLYAARLAPGKLLPADNSQARNRALEAFFYFVNDVIAPYNAGFSLLSGGGHAQAVAALTEKAVAAVEFSERWLSNSGFMGGDQFSIADIAGFTIASAASTKVSWARVPRLAEWRERVAARPGVIAGMAAFG